MMKRIVLIFFTAVIAIISFNINNIYAAVIDEVATRYIVILCLEMVLRNLQRLVDTFPNGNRRHHDDELGKAVFFVQFKDGLGVDIGFPRSCLHLHTKLQQLRLTTIH